MENLSVSSRRSSRSDAFKEVMDSCRSLSNYQAGFKACLPEIFSCIVTVLFHLMVGITLAYSASLIPKLQDEDSDIKVTEVLTSLIASIVVLMIPVASIVVGFVMEAIGRVNTLIIATIPFVAGWIMIAAANNVYWILAGRFLHGISIAVGSSPAIVYVTEVANPSLRSSLISIGQALACLGNLLAYIKGAYLDWRLGAWIYVIYSIIPGILLKFIPESPIWLVNKGRLEEASKSLQYVYKYYPQPEHTTETLADMHLKVLLREKAIREAEKASSTMKSQSSWAGFMKPTGYKPLIILALLFAIQQFSGTYITLVYAVNFLKDTGTEINPYIGSIYVGVVRFVMSIVSVWLLKYYKRRFLLMVSCVIMAISFFISGACTIWIQDGARDLSIVPLVCILIYVCASMVGVLSIPWTMTAELFPDEIRGLGHSIAFSVGTAIMFLALQSYSSLTNLLGGSHGIQWFFSAVSIFGFFFTLFFLPETFGKKLSEIEEYFQPKPKKNVNKPKNFQPPTIKISLSSSDNQIVRNGKWEV